MKQALICGISGQDGSYLAQLLLSKGYRVYGTSRDAQMSTFGNLIRLGIRDQVSLLSMAIGDFRSVLQVITATQPDEIYNLAGQSSVGLSFDQPLATLDSIAMGTLNLLEAIRFMGGSVKFYNASSSECFGDTGDTPATETTPFTPRSPYAVAKAAAFWQVANYREAYNLFACSGLLSNHDSPLRPARFVTQKIIATACEVAAGKDIKLELGNLAIQRDWGWAPEYVVAMYEMLQQDQPEDYVVSTGETHTLQEFVATAFQALGLEWQAHVQINPQLFRPTDILTSRCDPTKAKHLLGWQADHKMPDVIRQMIRAIQA